MISELKLQAMRTSEVTMAALVKMISESRFPLATHNKNKLLGSLSLAKRLHLAKGSLLNEDVHAKHAYELYMRYLSHWKKLRASAYAKDLSIKKYNLQKNISTILPEVNDASIAGNSLRFLTLIHSIELVNHTCGYEAAIKLKADLQAHIRKIKGLSCLGSIEVEVVSLKLMKRLAELDQVTEHRKLDVCEKLIEHKPVLSMFQDGESYLLVHFHGVISAKNEAKFEELNRILKTNLQWSVAPRQIELKKLSEYFGGRPKATEVNLKHIARYITKGGNDWAGGKAYLRYKVAFTNTMELNQEEWEALNWRSDTDLRIEHRLEGITDNLSLTHFEILTLATIIDALMDLDKNRTGYQLKIGNW